MSKKISMISIGVAGLIAMGSAYADMPMLSDGQAFNGVSLGFGLGYNKNKTKFDYLDGSYNKKPSASDIVGQLSLDYSMPIYDGFVMAVGATYDLNKTKAVKKSTSDIDTLGRIKYKDHYSLYVSPGYLIQDDILVYGKLGYHSAKLENKGGAVNSDKTFNGFGFGLGASYAFLPHMEVGLEANYVTYKEKTVDEVKVKPSTSTVFLTYKFRF